MLANNQNQAFEQPDTDIDGLTPNPITPTSGMDENLAEKGMPPGDPKSAKSRLGWSSMSLSTKATILAIAIGTLPLVGTLAATNVFVSQSLSGSIQESHIDVAEEIEYKVNRFMFERYGDVQVLANLPVLKNQKVISALSVQERRDTLARYVEIYEVYDSIAAYDLNGDLTLSTGGEASENVQKLGFYQEVMRTNQPVISQPQISPATGDWVIFLAAPIQNQEGQTVGIVRTRMPLKALNQLLDPTMGEGDRYLLLDKKRQVFATNESLQIGKPLQKVYPDLNAIQNLDPKKNTAKIATNAVTKVEKLTAYGQLPVVEKLPNLEWRLVYSASTEQVYAPLRQLNVTMLAGAGLAAVLVGAIATLIAKRATQPIVQAAAALEQIGQGDLDTRLPVVGDDELATLGANINQMAGQLSDLLDEQKLETEKIEKARQEARQEADERAEAQKQAKELLQKRALELLLEVDPVSKGDLTIRANVTPDEVGTIADSYNAIIRSLRQLVDQVQTASSAVADTAATNESSVSSLSDESRNQSEAIVAALDKIQTMVVSLQGVSDRAQQAEKGVQQATETIQAGDEAMNRTVEGISTIRETVSETAKKVKRLGEASQKISKVVNLISDFASQTNLLALNAAIEAARAGEEGRGFAVVAEEVRSLAQQSSAATAEIEQLVEEIQAQTNDVVTAMENGTEQVVMGTKLVQETRSKLTKITAVSSEINQLVKEISQAAAAQTSTSSEVSQTMQQVADIADSTSKRSETVAQSFTQLLEVAQTLQVSVAQFKTK
jgi:methyl-accepting chemotaxis protein PixJ